MDCNKIKKLLTEYIETETGRDLPAGIKKHLSSCSTCRGELAFLKRYKKEMASLKNVNAPRDFLAGLNLQLEKESRIPKLVKKLFFPLKIKLPIEAIGAAAAAILIIVLVHPGRLPEKSVYISKAAGDRHEYDKMSDDKMSDDKMSYDKMSYDKMSYDKMSYDKMSYEKGAPDLKIARGGTYSKKALTDRPTANKNADVLSVAERAAGKSGTEEIMEVYEITLVLKQDKEIAEGYYSSVPENEAKKSDDAVSRRKESEEKKMAFRREKMPKDKTEYQTTSATDPLENIKKIAITMKGNVIAEDPAKAGKSGSVTIEIPDTNRIEFIDRLGGLGIVRESTSLKKHRLQKAVKLKINIEQ